LGRLRSWLNQTPVLRTRQTGVALMTAAIVHLALSIAYGHPAGWLWSAADGIARRISAAWLESRCRRIVNAVASDRP